MELVTFAQLSQRFTSDKVNLCTTDTHELIFEDRVRMACFNCGHYDQNWKCPPKLPNLNYAKMISEFDNAAFVWVEYSLNKDNYADVRTESTNTLHKTLLAMEQYLLENGCPIYLSFIGGSCKLCKTGCGKDKCNNPYQSRSPLEATGVNVVKSAAKYGIHIEFPARERLIRLGLILW